MSLWSKLAKIMLVLCCSRPKIRDQKVRDQDQDQDQRVRDQDHARPVSRPPTLVGILETEIALYKQSVSRIAV